MLKNQLLKKLDSNSISGTLLPVFYARDEEDFGIGDIGSLIKAVNLTASLNQNILEILPVTFSSAYESPYSVLSSRCFNTIYINIPKLLHLLPCPKARQFVTSRQSEIKELRDLLKVDYIKVRELKNQVFFDDL